MSYRDPIEIPEESVELDVSHSNSELQPADGDASDYQGKGSFGAVVVHHTVTTLLIVMVVGVGTWGYLTFRSGAFGAGEFSLKAPLFEVPAGNAQLERFHFALDVYHTLYGKYPPDLEALLDEGLLVSSDLTHPPGSSTYTYERIGDSYELSVERTLRTMLEPDAEAPGEEQTDAPADRTPDAGHEDAS